MKVQVESEGTAGTTHPQPQPQLSAVRRLSEQYAPTDFHTLHIAHITDL
jgi:hypothetical protein